MLRRMSPSARCPGSCPPLRGSCFRAPLPRCGPTVATERDHPKYGRGVYLRVCGGCLSGSLPRGRKSARNRYREHASCQRFLGIGTEGAHLDSLVGIRAADGRRLVARRRRAAQTGRLATTRCTDWTPCDSERHRLDGRRQEEGQNGPYVSPSVESAGQLSPSVEYVAQLSPNVESASQLSPVSVMRASTPLPVNQPHGLHEVGERHGVESPQPREVGIARPAHVLP